MWKEPAEGSAARGARPSRGYAQKRRLTSPSPRRRRLRIPSRRLAGLRPLLSPPQSPPNLPPEARLGSSKAQVSQGLWERPGGGEEAITGLCLGQDSRIAGDAGLSCRRAAFEGLTEAGLSSGSLGLNGPGLRPRGVLTPGKAPGGPGALEGGPQGPYRSAGESSRLRGRGTGTPGPPRSPAWWGLP